jgi:Outer membrane protein beta-barrel domain
MLIKFRLGWILLLSSFLSPAAVAGAYIGLAPALIKIKTDSGSTKPLLADIRLGYALDEHKIELAFMSSIKNDNLNQLVTDIPLATSMFYRYTTNPKGSLQIDLILGYSQVEIETTYVQAADFSETYQGVSFGIGLEEALKSLPQLKIKLDYIRLYRGDQLNIDSLTLGVRYEF